MFITLYAYRAKPGQGHAIHALYSQWERLLTGAALSTELLSNSQDVDDMVMLARFQGEDAAWRAAESPDHRAWYAQLVRLTEEGPVVSQYQML